VRPSYSVSFFGFLSLLDDWFHAGTRYCVHLSYVRMRSIPPQRSSSFEGCVSWLGPCRHSPNVCWVSEIPSDSIGHEIWCTSRSATTKWPSFVIFSTLLSNPYICNVLRRPSLIFSHIHFFFCLVTFVWLLAISKISRFQSPELSRIVFLPLASPSPVSSLPIFAGFFFSPRFKFSVFHPIEMDVFQANGRPHFLRMFWELVLCFSSSEPTRSLSHSLLDVGCFVCFFFVEMPMPPSIYRMLLFLHHPLLRSFCFWKWKRLIRVRKDRERSGSFLFSHNFICFSFLAYFFSFFVTFRHSQFSMFSMFIPMFSLSFWLAVPVWVSAVLCSLLFGPSLFYRYMFLLPSASLFFTSESLRLVSFFSRTPSLNSFRTRLDSLCLWLQGARQARVNRRNRWVRSHAPRVVHRPRRCTFWMWSHLSADTTSYRSFGLWDTPLDSALYEV